MMNEYDFTDLQQNGKFGIYGKNAKGETVVLVVHKNPYLSIVQDKDIQTFIFNEQSSTSDIKRLIEGLIAMDPEVLKGYAPRDISDAKIKGIFEDIERILCRLDGLSMAETIRGPAIKVIVNGLAEALTLLQDILIKRQ